MAAATGWRLQNKSKVSVPSRLEAHGTALKTLKPMEVSEAVYAHFVFVPGAASECFPFGLSEKHNLVSK